MYSRPRIICNSECQKRPPNLTCRNEGSDWRGRRKGGFNGVAPAADPVRLPVPSTNRLCFGRRALACASKARRVLLASASSMLRPAIPGASSRWAFSFLTSRCSAISWGRGSAPSSTTSRTHTRSLSRLLSPASSAAKPRLWLAALVWIAHIGFDRALGFGLKYASRFGDTHLGRTGRRYSGHSHLENWSCASTPFRPVGCRSRRARSSAEDMAFAVASRR